MEVTIYYKDVHSLTLVIKGKPLISRLNTKLRHNSGLRRLELKRFNHMFIVLYHDFELINQSNNLDCPKKG